MAPAIVWMADMPVVVMRPQRPTSNIMALVWNSTRPSARRRLGRAMKNSINISYLVDFCVLVAPDEHAGAKVASMTLVVPRQAARRRMAISRSAPQPTPEQIGQPTCCTFET